MRPHSNLLHLIRSQVRGLLSLLPLVSAAVLSAALLAGVAGVAASWTTFQSSPVSTATPRPTDTPVPSPTDTAMPAPSDTPEATPTPAPTDTPVPSPTDMPTPLPDDTPASSPTVTPPPTDTPPPGTPTPLAFPPTNTPTATLESAAGAIQMPLLPPTATPELLPPTPAPIATAMSKPLLSPDDVGWIVVVVILALTAVVGLLLGSVLRNFATRS